MHTHKTGKSKNVISANVHSVYLADIDTFMVKFTVGIWLVPNRIGLVLYRATVSAILAKRTRPSCPYHLRYRKQQPIYTFISGGA